jgi:hypothetical protein
MTAKIAARVIDAKRFLYRLGFELFVVAIACIIGALGGWILSGH